MIDINVFLPMLLYIAGLVLLIVLIVLAVKCISVVDKCDKILENLDEKVNSLNGAFNVVKRISNGVGLIGDKIVDSANGFVEKIINKKNGEEYDDYE